jgi:hypothetical protein
MFGPPKTSNGEARRVDLSQMGVGVLLEHQLRQAGQREQLGDAYADLAWCSPTSTATP